MKKFITACAIVISILQTYAQDDYYYYKGTKISLTKDESLSNSTGDTYFNRSGDASSIGVSEIFYIKLKELTDFELLEQVATEKNAIIVHQNSFMPLWYKLQVNTNNSSIEIGNQFYETGYFADMDPAFQFNFSENCTNDLEFDNLWGLLNISDSDIDINACDAWTITEGNNINVAVIDQGIDKTHFDLDDNISVLSYDAQSGSSPSVFISGNSHGTHVAGTIGAEKDNNLQVVGVAPQSNIMSVSHSLSLTQNISEELANGINWAVQNGADIINNSWGDQGGLYYDQLHSAILEDAITNAVTNGRNGLGTIIVFAAGNKSPVIDYPANSNSQIIVTGSITSIGNRSSFSGYGDLLDIVAPGSGIVSTIPGQSIDTYNGTSMAAPHVSGVAALILSVNPNLTIQEVSSIIGETAQKIGGYSYASNSDRSDGTWNEEMGYGLIDAYQAVLLAQSYGCIEEIIVIEDVISGDFDYKIASKLIDATNIIYSGGSAEYQAGETVFLSPGFHAESSSSLNVSIGACNASATNLSSKSISNTEAAFESSSVDFANFDEKQSILNIYPNPTSGLSKIESTDVIIKYSINDITGKQIIFRDQINLNSVNIDLSNYNSGIYFLETQNEKGEITRSKIIKQ